MKVNRAANRSPRKLNSMRSECPFCKQEYYNRGLINHMSVCHTKFSQETSLSVCHTKLSQETSLLQNKCSSAGQKNYSSPEQNDKQQSQIKEVQVNRFPLFYFCLQVAFAAWKVLNFLLRHS